MTGKADFSKISLPLGALALAATLGAGIGIVTLTTIQGASAATELSAPLNASLPDSRASAFEVNVNGQTFGEYGVGLRGDDNANPELFRAVGIGGVVGYLYTTDVVGELPANPEEAIRQQERHEAIGWLREREVPLYAEDGTTVVGAFLVNGGYK